MYHSGFTYHPAGSDEQVSFQSFNYAQRLSSSYALSTSQPPSSHSLQACKEGEEQDRNKDTYKNSTFNLLNDLFATIPPPSTPSLAIPVISSSSPSPSPSRSPSPSPLVPIKELKATEKELSEIETCELRRLLNVGKRVSRAKLEQQYKQHKIEVEEDALLALVCPPPSPAVAKYGANQLGSKNPVIAKDSQSNILDRSRMQADIIGKAQHHQEISHDKSSEKDLNAFSTVELKNTLRAVGICADQASRFHIENMIRDHSLAPKKGQQISKPKNEAKKISKVKENNKRGGKSNRRKQGEKGRDSKN